MPAGLLHLIPLPFPSPFPTTQILPSSYLPKLTPPLPTHRHDASLRLPRRLHAADGCWPSRLRAQHRQSQEQHDVRDEAEAAVYAAV